jgi:hypothetical protein
VIWNKDLDNLLRLELIDLLSSYPPLIVRDGRDAWLLNLPEHLRDYITKRSDNCKYDLAFIIEPIKTLQFLDGRWVLLVMIDHLLPQMSGLTFRNKLETLRQKIKNNLQEIESEEIQRTYSEFDALKPCPATFDDLLRTNQDCAHLVRHGELVDEIIGYFSGTPKYKLRPVVLFGQPMAGKTETLKHLFDVTGDDYVPLVIDVQGTPLSNLDYFLYGMASQAATQFSEWAKSRKLPLKLDDLDTEAFAEGNGITAFGAFWDHLRAVADKRQPIVMIDEIERLSDHPEKLDTRIPAFLDGFIHKMNNGYVILAGSERILDLGDERLKPLIEKRQPVRVCYLKEETTVSFFSIIQDCYFSLESDALRYIIALCDGNPRVLRNFYEVIALLVNQSPGKQKVQRSDIEWIVLNVIERIQENVLLTFWERLSPNERSVVHLISRKPVIFDPVTRFECRMEALLDLADKYISESTTNHDHLKQGVEALAERELIEWKNGSKALFRFRLGILPLWVRSYSIDSMGYKGRNR